MTRHSSRFCRILSPFALGAALFAGLTGATATARAQGSPGYVETERSGERGVIFDDDLTSGASHCPVIDIFKGRRTAARALLLRPRFQFVGEMLKSVENL